jgi:acyl-CoA thioesterase I
MKIDCQKLLHLASVRAIGCLIVLWVALVSPRVEAATILVLGDSLSAGYGIRQQEAWPSLLEQRLRSNPLRPGETYRVVNGSISGETTAGGLRRLVPLLDRHRPDIVLLALGANDGLRGLSLQAMRSNLKTMLDQVKERKARAVLIGMRLPPNYGPFAESFHVAFADVARQAKVAYVPFLLDGLDQGPRHFQADGLHPNREAQPILLENVWPALQSVMR